MGNRLIEGLKTGQRYIVQVRAKDSAGAFGTYSDVVEITTSTEVTPRAPTSVVLTGTVDKWIGTKYKIALTLTWVAPIETVVSKYEAILEEFSGGAWAVADVTNAEAYPAKTATEQKWTDHTSSGQYRARIRAISKGNAVGTWSDYSALTLSFTSDLPTPTGLALKQDGKKITASVTAVSQATYPQLAGYRYYASKQTAFTPGATNLIAEPKSNKLTFQEAYDSTHTVIEEIEIADTIYVRVSCFDAAGNESAKCAEVSVLAGGAVPNAPASVTLTLTISTIAGRVYNVKSASAWTAPTNVELSGYEQEIYNAANGGGTLEKTLSPAKGATASNWTDSDPDTAYSTRIRAINKWGRIGTYSSWANASALVDSTAPASPTVTSVNGMFQFFILKWVRNSEADLNGYIVYVNTSNSTPTKADGTKIISRTSKYSTNKILRIGEVTETSSGGITLAINTTYYFWLSAIDVAGNEANLTAFGSAITTGGITGEIVISETPASRNIPSSYYLDLRGHKNSDYVWHVTTDWATLHDGSTPWKTKAVPTWNVTCDISTAGPEAGGRDQAGAFTADSWIHFYLIVKSSDDTKSMIASASASAPTLPTGYDYYMRCSSGRVRADDTLAPIVQFNATHFGSTELLHDVHPTTADTWQSLDLSAYVPATATMWSGSGGQTAACIRCAMGVRSGSATQDITHSWVMAISAAGIMTGALENAFSFTLPLTTAQACEWTSTQDTYHGLGMNIVSYVDDL